ncbi:hypothetical protein WA1_04540 [Scytonema hofmannii PCC 7110]|uniref:Transposase n=1 Tax=Scytonema hofmannii PCC 7110 TaxID=128403 RepID=A0A139WZU9_9CYAN|nr:hypothetical protein WA1_04540 [Scytonema hofmannii PCC 7110]
MDSSYFGHIAVEYKNQVQFESLMVADCALYSVYLKRPERIEALAMVMGLCLLVYKLAQRQIRLALYESQLTVKNQLGKPIYNPTLKWIFQNFQSIHVVSYYQEIKVSNWTPERDFILKLFPESCHRYYQVIT